MTIKLGNVIGARDTPRLIVDAKYKNPLIEHHGDRFRNSDLYQVFTYAAALDAPAVLVHPRVDQDVDVEFGAGPHRTRILSVPLHRGIRETCWISSLQVAAEQFTGPLVAGADGG